MTTPTGSTAIQPDGAPPQSAPQASAQSPSAPQLSTARIRLALLSLALGGFAIGSTEFVAMGLLPQLAQDLLPQLYGVSSAEANARMGWAISAYALGVVVGAPTIAAFAAKLQRKRLLLILLVAFTLATVASALAPGFGSLLIARFLSALPHGAYFGVASLVAASLMGPGKRGRGISLVLAGLTLANVVGVPAITWLGQTTSWRIAYLVVAAIFALTFVAVLSFVPWQAADATATVRNELRAFARGQVWMVLAIGAIGFGGFFAVYSYISPLAVQVTGLAPSAVPVLLIVIGLGMTVGNLLGGAGADRNLPRTMLGYFCLLLVSLVLLALTAQYVVALGILIFVIAVACSALSPAIQTRLMDVARESRTIGAALNHSALNLANASGAFLGGITIAAGYGYLSPLWVGAVLTAAGIVLTAVSFHRGRRASLRVRRG